MCNWKLDAPISFHPKMVEIKETNKGNILMVFLLREVDGLHLYYFNNDMSSCLYSRLGKQRTLLVWKPTFFNL